MLSVQTYTERGAARSLRERRPLWRLGAAGRVWDCGCALRPGSRARCGHSRRLAFPHFRGRAGGPLAGGSGVHGGNYSTQSFRRESVYSEARSVVGCGLSRKHLRGPSAGRLGFPLMGGIPGTLVLSHLNRDRAPLTYTHSMGHVWGWSARVVLCGRCSPTHIRRRSAQGVAPYGSGPTTYTPDP